MGDFNYPGINWIDGLGFTSSISSEEQRFADLIMDFYSYQFVNEPTRHNNILDLVFSNRPMGVASVETGLSIAEVGIPSDHYPVIFNIEVNLKLKNLGKRLCYDFKNADFESLNNELLLLPLCAGVGNSSCSLSQRDLNDEWKQWNDLVFAAIDTNIPKVPRRSSNKLPWISKELAKAINKKKSLWKRVKKSKSTEMVEKFRKLRQSIKN